MRACLGDIIIHQQYCPQPRMAILKITFLGPALEKLVSPFAVPASEGKSGYEGHALLSP